MTDAARPDAHLYLVDGTSQLFRAYFAIRGLTGPNGAPTNAVFGFTSMLRKLLKDERPPYLGVAFGFGIPMAYAAAQNLVPDVAWWMLLANVFWAIAYDTEYAMVDKDDDLKIGIKSSAIFFGRFDVIAVMACYAAMLCLLVYIGQFMGYKPYYYIGLLAALVLVCRQYVLIKARNKISCFNAFLHNNWIGFAVFAGIAANYFLSVN